MWINLIHIHQTFVLRWMNSKLFQAIPSSSITIQGLFNAYPEFKATEATAGHCQYQNVI